MPVPSVAPAIHLGNRAVGPGHPVYVIAELSANHHQQYSRAVELVHAAAAAKTDAVKLQTYTADTMTIDIDAPAFRVKAGTPWSGRRLHELYEEAMTPWDWQPRLKQEAEALGMQCFSTPFDATAIDFLVQMDVPAYKVASFELVDLDLVRRVASVGRPVILSTGMATAAEIDAAIDTAREAGATELALLRCNSAYPAPPDEMDLRAIPDMAARWKVPIGLSDHTLGTTAVIAAVALGATIIEKHLTLSRADPGPDAGFSLEPDEFSAMVRGVREAEATLGEVRYGPSPSETSSLTFRRSLFVVAAVDAGEPFSAANVRSIRPGHGLPPRFLPEVLGKRATRRLEAGTPLLWDAIGD